MSEKREVATLAGGCFWCLEAVYDDLRRVTDVVSGYAGGSVPDPSYEAVCSGATMTGGGWPILTFTLT